MHRAFRSVTSGKGEIATGIVYFGLLYDAAGWLVVIHVKDKSLVVLTGCGHAGVINTLLRARTITSDQEIYAVIGGFHLTGAIFEPIIPPTLQALQEINPKGIVPQHCTGWKANLEIARQFPRAFFPTSVGTRYVL